MAQSRNYKGNNNRNRSQGNNRGNNNRSNNNRSNNNRNDNRSNNNRNDRKGGNNQASNASKENQAPPREQQGTVKKAPVSSNNDLLWFFLVMILVAGGFLANKYYLGPRRPGIYNSKYVSPPLKREGRLSFVDAQAGKNIIDLDIEIAKTQRERDLGLKNRKFLPADGGFLYVFEKEAIRTFTMESVFVSLDILFIDANQKIIRINKNATARSPASIPSGGKAQYVLQVQAGFCDAFTIRVGDYIEF